MKDFRLHLTVLILVIVAEKIGNITIAVEKSCCCP